MTDDSAAPGATFHVTAIWDPEAAVFWSQSDIPGLHVEADSYDEFVALVEQWAPEMVADNLPEVTGPFAVRVNHQPPSTR